MAANRKGCRNPVTITPHITAAAPRECFKGHLKRIAAILERAAAACISSIARHMGDWFGF